MAKKKNNRLTLYIFIGMGLGLLIGAVFPHVGAQLRPLSLIFIRLIKSIIAPSTCRSRESPSSSVSMSSSTWSGP